MKAQAIACEIWEYLLADMDSPIEPMDIVNRPYPQSLFAELKELLTRLWLQLRQPLT